MEKCYGCFAKAEEHPVVGIINKADIDSKGKPTILPNVNSDSEFVGVPVCAECHKDPEHRTAHDLKCHFFMRDDKKVMVAMIMAGSENIG